MKEQVQFFHNKHGTGPIKWTTGTVTEILRMWTILHDPGPQWQSLQKESNSLEAHMSQWLLLSRPFSGKRERNSPKTIPFKDHQASQARSVSFDNKVSYINNEVSYMDTRSMMFDGPETCQTPPTSLSCSPPALSPPRCHSPRSPSYSPPGSFPSRESSIEPSSEDSSPKGRKRY